MNKVQKFAKDLKLREWAEIERRTGMGMSELGQAGAGEAEFQACLLLVAKKRAGTAYRFEDAENLTLEECAEELIKVLGAIGFEDDPEDEDAEPVEEGKAPKLNGSAKRK